MPMGVAVVDNRAVAIWAAVVEVVPVEVNPTAVARSPVLPPRDRGNTMTARGRRIEMSERECT